MRSLIKGLPPESALSRALSPDTVDWGNAEELLATQIEMTDLSNRLYIQAHSDEHAKAPEPVKVPRPYQRYEAPKDKTAEIKEFFEDIRVVS
jgi:hypothetical protein